jgi:hypothetical protein
MFNTKFEQNIQQFELHLMHLYILINVHKSMVCLSKPTI